MDIEFVAPDRQKGRFGTNWGLKVPELAPAFSSEQKMQFKINIFK